MRSGWVIRVLTDVEVSLLALKTIESAADFTRRRGRVSFFGFIDVPAEMASLAEIAILFLLDSSPSALNLYASGAAVGFVLRQRAARGGAVLDRATRAAAPSALRHVHRYAQERESRSRT